MIVSAIVAVAKNNVIGRDNDIPWYLPGDLQYFKRTTLGHHIIMGRNCFQSIGRPLPKRTNVVLSRNLYFTASNCLIARSVEEALTLAENNGEQEAFIIGGGEIYEQSLPFWDRLYLTEVDVRPEGDVFFPELDPKEWELESEEMHPADEKNEYAYTFKIYNRRA